MRSAGAGANPVLSSRIMRTLKATKIPARAFLAASAFVVLAAVWQTRPFFGIYSSIGALLLVPAIALCAAGIMASSVEQKPEDKHHIWSLRAVMAIALLYHCFASIWLLSVQPATGIDVYLFQHHSAAALLRGVDPYTLTTENIYGPHTLYYGPETLVRNRVQIGLPYPPASLFFILPGFLLGDLRYAYFTAVILSALTLIRLHMNWATVGVACALLLSPMVRYVELQSWTEPFVLLTLTCTVYAAVKRSWWLPIALGCFFASKQYSILALPFTPMLLGNSAWKPTRRLLSVGMIVATTLTLPMALWNVPGFWRDIVLCQFRQPFRKDSLSLGNLLFPIPLPAILVLVVIGVIFAMRRARPHPSMFAACFGFVFLIFVAVNKQAFCNYYFLVIHTLLLSAATIGLPFPEEVARKASTWRPLTLNRPVRL